MWNLVDTLYETYTKPKKRIPLVSLDDKIEGKTYLNPSSTGVYTSGGGQALGACIKKVWLDKKGFEQSNPSNPYNKLNFDFGNMIEDWVIQKCKYAGIYLASNVKLIDNELSLSGEIDILVKNPETNEMEVIEVKSYNASNYQTAKEVLGSKDNYPIPKDGYVLQCVVYLIMLRRYGIKKVNLLYVDKSASKLYNNKQFVLFLQGDDIYYQTMYQGRVIETKEERYTVKDILERNQVILDLIEQDYVPPPDFKMVYTPQEVEDNFIRGSIPKYKYDAFKKNPMTTELGDFQCAYCPYGVNPETGESTCINITNETKDFYK